jgi:glycosyltransferase A (GT-A) superfamily protein (DUF2064 family)
MRQVFGDLFARGARRVVMLGADAPQLGADAIAASFAALAVADVVLTPTRDGGYCLIGLRAAHDLFQAVDMGTGRVRAQTLARATALALTVIEQPATFDVDEWEDVLELRRLLDSRALELPHTAAALRQLRPR